MLREGPQRANKIRLIFAFLTLLMAAGRPALAVNTGYLPGDCVYHFELSKSLIQELQLEKREPVRLWYDNPDWVPYSLCGYAGYWALDGREFHKDLKQNLVDAYRSYRKREPVRFRVTVDEETGNETRVEMNPLSALIYNADFDFHQYGLFIKYNENWPQESIEWGWSAKGVKVGKYFPFINSPDSIMTEWLHAAEVRPLSVGLPVNLEETVGPQCTRFMSLTGPMMLVLTSGKASEFEKPAEGLKILVVTEKEFVEYRFARRKGWVKQTDKETEESQ